MPPKGKSKGKRRKSKVEREKKPEIRQDVADENKKKGKKTG